MQVIRQTHLLHVLFADLGMVYNGLGIILAKRNTGVLEYTGRCVPGLVYVLLRKLLQLGKPLANVGPTFVVFLLKCNWRVATEVLVEESRAR